MPELGNHVLRRSRHVSFFYSHVRHEDLNLDECLQDSYTVVVDNEVTNRLKRFERLPLNVQIAFDVEALH